MASFLLDMQKALFYNFPISVERYSDIQLLVWAGRVKYVGGADGAVGAE